MTNPITSPLPSSKADKKQNVTSNSVSTGNDIGSKQSDNKQQSSDSFSSENSDSSNHKQSSSGNSSKQSEQSGTSSDRVYRCPYCDGNHNLDRCEGIAAIDIEARQIFIKAHGLCFACLRKGHLAFQCRGRLKCRICDRRHATIMHQDNFSAANANSTHANEDDTGDSASSA